jgi:hypothetical protein
VFITTSTKGWARSIIGVIMPSILSRKTILVFILSIFDFIDDNSFLLSSNFLITLLGLYSEEILTEFQEQMVMVFYFEMY